MFRGLIVAAALGVAALVGIGAMPEAPESAPVAAQVSNILPSSGIAEASHGGGFYTQWGYSYDGRWCWFLYNGNHQVINVIYCY